MLFNAGKAGATKLHKLSMFVVYPGPTAVMRGNIRNLVEKDREAAAFLRALPWNYDDTRVFDADISRHVAVVRRRGGEFFVGAMAGEAEHETKLLLDFLPEGGEWEAELLFDDLSDEGVPRGCRHERRTVRREDTLEIRMAKAGGFCAIIRRRLR